MKTFFTLCLCILFATACGKSNQNETLTTSNPFPPSPGPTLPKTTPQSTLKWAENVIAEQTQYCAEAGSAPYSFDQWKVFCRCTYEIAAARWTFKEFSDGFDEKYDELLYDGTVLGCLKKSGIYSNP